jgi:membrane-bound inhibitor of C-type lysozyme
MMRSTPLRMSIALATLCAVAAVDAQASTCDDPHWSDTSANTGVVVDGAEGNLLGSGGHGFGPIHAFQLAADLPTGASRSADYLCPNGTHVKVVYHLDARTAVVSVGRATGRFVLDEVMSGSGARYSDGTREIWEHQGTLRVTMPGGVTLENCAKY